MWSVRQAVFDSGERYPILVDQEGIPAFWATLFVTIQYRNASKAAKTQATVLQAIKLLFDYCSENNIEIQSRLQRQEGLSDPEVEGLTRHCRQSAQARRLRHGVTPLHGSELLQVSNKAVADRLTYITQYLEWVSSRLQEEVSLREDSDGTANPVALTAKRIRSRRPKTSRFSSMNARIALSDDAQKTLLELINPSSVENPFSSSVKFRNYLIVRLLLDTGIRIGELLALRVDDINFQEETLKIARRHDQEEDPRRDQPVVKTHDRELNIPSDLAGDIYDYVAQERRLHTGGSIHEYLFVVHKSGPYSGYPITYRSIDKIFKKIRNARPDELRRISPHTLRHTMNYNLSKLFDKQGTSEEKEERIRSYVNGWKYGSGSSAFYIKRHIEESAGNAMQEIQARIMKGDDDE